MSQETSQRSGIRPYQVIYVLGLIICAVPIIHGITGYYPHDLVWMVPMGFVGVVLMWIAQRIRRGQHRQP